MSETMKKPRIRFKGFTEAWEQRKLGELALFNPKDELPQTFEYVDLESVVGTEMLSHRTEAKSSAPSRAQRLAHTGDLFYQTVRPYQKNNYLFEKPDNNYVFSTGYAQMRPYVDGYFLLSLVQSDRFVKVVLDNCTGTSYPAINANDLAEIEVTAPSDENEAQKIGTIFRNIDNLITLHQRKYDKLLNIKKSMLEKMFPKNGNDVPEIRFKGFTDAWEQRKLGEVVEIKDSARIPNTEWTESGVPYIRASDITNEDMNGVLFISRERYEFYKNRTGSPAQGDVLFNGGGEIGKTMLNTDNEPIYVQGGAVLYARTSVSKVLNGQYLKVYFETPSAKNYIGAASAGGTMKHFTLKPSQEMPIKISTMQEQQKIGDYFSNLDNLITLHQRKLEKLKNIKKSMLEKMFV